MQGLLGKASLELTSLWGLVELIEAESVHLSESLFLTYPQL